MPPMVFMTFLFSLSNTNPLTFEGWAISLLGLTVGSRGRRSGHYPTPGVPPSWQPLRVDPNDPHLVALRALCNSLPRRVGSME